MAESAYRVARPAVRPTPTRVDVSVSGAIQAHTGGFGTMRRTLPGDRPHRLRNVVEKPFLRLFAVVVVGVATAPAAVFGMASAPAAAAPRAAMSAEAAASAQAAATG